MRKSILPALGFVFGIAVSGCASKPQTVKDDGASKANLDGNKQLTGNAVQAKSDDTAGQGDYELDSLLQKATIHFDFAGAELSTESRDRLDRVAAALKKHEKVAIKIEGNCDERGTEEYNMSLGMQRADAARKYLGKLGIDESRISTVSYGEGMPVDTRQTEEAYSANRRDDIKVEKKQ